MRRVFNHVNAVKRTDIDAKFAAGTVVHDDFGLRDVLWLDTLDEIAVLVFDAGYGTENRADPAIDAVFLVNGIQLFGFAADGVDRTLQLANTAANTGVINEIGHESDSL